MVVLRYQAFAFQGHKNRLKETSGSGTVATRATIIEELKAERCQYLSLKGK